MIPICPDCGAQLQRTMVGGEVALRCPWVLTSRGMGLFDQFMGDDGFAVGFERCGRPYGRKSPQDILSATNRK